MNQYDKYVGSEYIPIPFSAYMQAGQQQEKEYQKNRETLDTTADALTSLPSRAVDVAGKNALLNEYHQAQQDLMGKYGKYSPTMDSDVRQLARRYANDPRVKGLVDLAGMEKEDRKQRDEAKRAGKIWEYGQDIYTKPYLDQSGKAVWQDYQNHAPQFENLQNHVKAADEVMAKLQPWMSTIKPHLRNIDGITYLEQGHNKTLLANDPRVEKHIQDNIPSFLATPEGDQYYRMKKMEALNNPQIDYSHYEGLINPATGNHFTKEEAADKYALHATEGLLKARVPEVKDNQTTYSPLSKANLEELKGTTKTPRPKIDNFFESLLQINRTPSASSEKQAITDATPNEEIARNLTPKETEHIRDVAGKAWLQKKKEIDAWNSGENMVNHEVGNTPGELKPLSEYIDKSKEDYINSLKDKAKTEPSNKYVSAATTIPTEEVETYKNAFGNFRPEDMIISEGGKGYDGSRLADFLAKEGLNDLPITSLFSDITPVGIENNKVPGRVTSIPMVKYEVKISPEFYDKLSSLSSKAKEFIGLTKDGKPVRSSLIVSLPADKMYNPATAMSINKKYDPFVDPKDPGYQDQYRQNHQVMSQMNDAKETIAKQAIANNNIIKLGDTEAKYDPTTESVTIGDHKISLTEFTLRILTGQ